MRITLKVDSATTQEIYNLTLAFQRTSGLLRDSGYGGHEIPAQITRQPMVTVGGSTMGWESPGLTPGHADALLAEFDRLQRGVFGGPSEDTGKEIRWDITSPVAHPEQTRDLLSWENGKGTQEVVS